MCSILFFSFVPYGLFSLISSTVYSFVSKIITYIEISRKEALVHDGLPWCNILDWWLSPVILVTTFFVPVSGVYYRYSAYWKPPCVLRVIFMWVILLSGWISMSIYITSGFGLCKFVSSVWVDAYAAFVRVRSLTFDDVFKDLAVVLLFVAVMSFWPCWCYLCF